MLLRFSEGVGLGAAIVRTGQRYISKDDNWQLVHVDIHMGKKAGKILCLGAHPKYGVGYYLAEPKETDKYLLITGDARKFMEVVRPQIGKTYDYSGVIANTIPGRDWFRTFDWYCSELVAYGLSKATGDPYLFNRHQLGPSKLYNEALRLGLGIEYTSKGKADREEG